MWVDCGQVAQPVIDDRLTGLVICFLNFQSKSRPLTVTCHLQLILQANMVVKKIKSKARVNSASSDVVKDQRAEELRTAR